MDKKLQNLFDYQRFAGNDDIEKMYCEAETRYPRELSEDELEQVSAAGVGRGGSTRVRTGKTSTTKSSGGNRQNRNERTLRFRSENEKDGRGRIC